jgi:gamma-glutamyltranspeptidase/glutathione hydrolase
MKKCKLNAVIFFTVVLLCFGQIKAASSSAIIGNNGAVTSGSLLASEVGVEIMKQGGNAIDAAVATGFALAVTHPSAGNIGGGSFILFQNAKGESFALDAREVAPLKATRDMYQDEKGNLVKGLSTQTHLASGVPGTVDGYLKLHDRFGKLSREKVLTPAIRLAQKGFKIDQALAAELKGERDNFNISQASLKKFTRNGRSFEEGYLWKQPDLAKTLKRIAKDGRAGFYEGETAQYIVNEMNNGRGIISKEDLKSYQSVWREPLKGSFNGAQIVAMPPSSSGGVLIIQMLNMLESIDLSKLEWGSADYIHLLIEAERRAYADRAEHLGDTDFYDVPLAKLMDKEYAKTRFKSFQPKRASDSESIGPGSWPKESTDTTHFSVADAEGNVVSITTTLNFSYGNKITVSGAGFLLNNEMDDFSTKPGVANAYGLLGSEANEVQPKKRMLSSMSPTIVNKDGKALLVTGSPGGSTIITSTLQVMLNVLLFDMDIAKAVEAPRFHHQWKPNTVRYEQYGISPDTLNILKKYQHKGLQVSKYPLGDTNSILLKEGTVQAVNDSRRRGGASAF